MKLKASFTVISTDRLPEARDFYVRYFGFEAVFDTGWYVHLHGAREGSEVPLELAFMTPGNKDLPAEFQTGFNGNGVFISIEVEDVDAIYQQLMRDGFEPIQDLCDEPWGQRHFVIRDPGGTFVDIVKSIPPSEEYQQAHKDFFADR